MHDTALIFAKKFFETYLVEKKDLRIVDLGSFNVNGDIKEIFSKSHEYIGLDLEKGPNVDIVMSDPYKIPLEENSIDIVISTSCFEQLVEHQRTCQRRQASWFHLGHFLSPLSVCSRWTSWK